MGEAVTLCMRRSSMRREEMIKTSIIKGAHEVKYAQSLRLLGKMK
jgi:hypothetical protein